jgi:peptidoglycan/xylan/chitin deacetylase (PgdA/CDA1 family)
MHSTKSVGIASDRTREVRKNEPTTVPQTISSWPTGRKLVALTYDDGPHPTITPKLIELLKRKNAPATFFLLGQSVKAYPSIARQLADIGFEIGNHSFSHPQLTKLSEEAIRRELTQCAELITSATGGAPIRVMRPTYGAHNERVRRIATEMGYNIILWDVDTNDWRKRTTDQMVATILSSVKDGSIILMHDRYSTTLETTAAVIDELRARGFTFVTVSEMLEQPRSTSRESQ